MGIGANPHLEATCEATCEMHHAKRKVLGVVARLQTLLAEPADFIHHLASQNQILACLQWLGEFQVLACIPLSGSVPAKDVADMAGVPETQLCRVVRMTSTVGFLIEPQSGHIAHTMLSASFVTKLNYLDAAIFLAETAAPTALQMTTATQLHGHSDRPTESAYTLTSNSAVTFQLACEQRPKLQRQWAAYRRCAQDTHHTETELLSRLDWHTLGNACIVEVGARSTATATALAELYPALHFIVQMGEGASEASGTVDASKPDDIRRRITAQRRTPGARQMVGEAAVYILRHPSPSLSAGAPSRILAELHAHLGVLRANSVATLVLLLHLLPEPGTVDPDVEAIARLRDLTLLQLTNEREMEMEDLVDMVNSVHDGAGRLAVINKFRSRNSLTVALGIRYQAYINGEQKLLEPTIM
ncbi:O-methyltransferase family protein [Xylogone sp. PMI_703]|nr:O-methyltransferase family protein [Xylogone sp. PMI_703]